MWQYDTSLKDGCPDRTPTVGRRVAKPHPTDDRSTGHGPERPAVAALLGSVPEDIDETGGDRRSRRQGLALGGADALYEESAPALGILDDDDLAAGRGSVVIRLGVD
jgi:hypothetical protein